MPARNSTTPPVVPSDGDPATAAGREHIARRLLALTREMRTLGESGDWVGFAEREAERQALSRELFATPVPHEAAPVVADCVRRVLELDETLIELARAHRDEAARMLEASQRGRQAADAYRRFSR